MRMALQIPNKFRHMDTIHEKSNDVISELSDVIENDKKMLEFQKMVL